MNRLVVRSYAENRLVDDIDDQFRVPLREQGVRLICHRRPQGKRYDAEYPYVFSVCVSVLAPVAAEYLIRLIDFVTPWLRRHARGLIVLVVGTVEKRFVLPKEAADAKRHIAKSSRKSGTQRESAKRKKPARRKRK